MNQKGFANIVLIILVVVLAGALGYVMLVKKPASVEQPQTNNLQNSQSTTPPPSNNAVVQNPPANISQLTKAQVLNGYDQCGIQFSNGEISIGYDKYTQLEQTCSAAVSGASISSDEIVLADLDSDGIIEAIVPVRVVRASSGGALYVFKNINGTARVVDSVIIGKENIKIVSVNKDVIVGKTDGAMGYTSTTKIYKFVNGKLIAQ